MEKEDGSEDDGDAGDDAEQELPGFDVYHEPPFGGKGGGVGTLSPHTST